MCFSLQWSIASAAVGLATAGFMQLRNVPKSIYIPIAYFSSMEILQALQYLVIDQCDNAVNVALTYLSYVHIAFQPFMWLFFYSYFATTSQKQILMGPFARIAIICGIFFVSRLYFNEALPPNFEFGQCTQGLLCGSKTCAFQGANHVGWNLTLRKVSFHAPGFFTYFLLFLIFPVSIGLWKQPLILCLLGPVLATLVFPNSHINELPSIWCLLAVPQFIMVWWSYWRKERPCHGNENRNA